MPRGRGPVINPRTARGSFTSYPGLPKRGETPFITDLSPPFIGRIGDAVPLTWNSRTLPSYGSVNVRPGTGATAVSASDTVIAIVALATLLASELPLIFSDRAPGKGATFSVVAPLDELPWDRLRRHVFSPSVGDPEDAARYDAEALVFGMVPLGVVHALAVVDQGAADRLGRRRNRRKDPSLSDHGLPGLLSPEPVGGSTA